MKINRLCTAILAVSFGITSCKKDAEQTNPTDATAAQILADFGPKVAIPTYENLHSKSLVLKDLTVALRTNPTQENLQAAQNQWYAVRTAWEQSECMLFGPVATEGLDPAIDTWPVSQNEVDSLLTASSSFTAVYIDGLGEGLKGFHPMEYLLFGVARSRQVSELDIRKLDYLVALSTNLASKTEAMHTGWKESGGNYAAELSNAGKGSTTYPKRLDGMLEVANAILGIIDEVGNGKIEEPFVAQDPGLEESPFSLNSWNDFRDNMIGAKNVYMGKVLGGSAVSLHDFTAKHNASLDAQIQQKFDAAIANLGHYTLPFGQSILSQKPQVEATQASLKAIETQMEDELIPLIQLYVKD